VGIRPEGAIEKSEQVGREVGRRVTQPNTELSIQTVKWVDGRAAGTDHHLEQDGHQLADILGPQVGLVP
jgi:hypothetical protein